MTGTRRRLWIVTGLLALTALLAPRSGGAAPPGVPLLAQVDPLAPGAAEPGADDPEGPSWDLPLRIALFVALTFTGAIVWYFLLFPSLLRRATRPVWPIDAYGMATACTWVTTCLLLLGLFWRELVLPQVRLGSGVASEYGLKVVVMIVMLAGAPLFWNLGRGEARRARPAPNAGA